MVQVRKLVLAIAAASALSSGMAHALGLGELTLKSTLNQPLVAEIELLDVKDLTAAEVVPSLASPEDFAKAGVDRQAFLNDLTFTPVLNATGVIVHSLGDDDFLEKASRVAQEINAEYGEGMAYGFGADATSEQSVMALAQRCGSRGWPLSHWVNQPPWTSHRPMPNGIINQTTYFAWGRVAFIHSNSRICPP